MTPSAEPMRKKQLSSREQMMRKQHMLDKQRMKQKQLKIPSGHMEETEDSLRDKSLRNVVVLMVM